MRVCLVVYYDIEKTQLMGIYIFSSYKNLMKKTKNFFDYNDLVGDSIKNKKKKIFKIIKF